jgi:hypothetical protein
VVEELIDEGADEDVVVVEVCGELDALLEVVVEAHEALEVLLGVGLDLGDDGVDLRGCHDDLEDGGLEDGAGGDGDGGDDVALVGAGAPGDDGVEWDDAVEGRGEGGVDVLGEEEVGPGRAQDGAVGEADGARVGLGVERGGLVELDDAGVEAGEGLGQAEEHGLLHAGFRMQGAVFIKKRKRREKNWKEKRRKEKWKKKETV